VQLLGYAAAVDLHLDLVGVEADVFGCGESLGQRMGQAPGGVIDLLAVCRQVPVLPVALIRTRADEIAPAQQFDPDVSQRQVVPIGLPVSKSSFGRSDSATTRPSWRTTT
jgi:hypothetical protein